MDCRRTLCGCVDWNEDMLYAMDHLGVAPYVGAWIETVWNRKQVSVLLKLKQEFDSLSKDEKNNILLNLKTLY